MRTLSITILSFLLATITFNASAQPDWQWANAFGQGTDPNYQSTDVKNIAADSDGNYYVVGIFDETITGEGFYFEDEDAAEQLTGMVVGFNSAGEYQWHHQIYSDDGTQYTEVSINGVATDSNGDVYVTGSFCGTANISETISITSTAVGTYSMFVVKYSGVDGTPLWAVDAVGTSSSEGRNIAIDSNDDIYITGYFSGDANFGSYPLTAESTDGFVAKYNSGGVCQWASKLGGSSSEYCLSIAVDNSNNIFVIGLYSGTPTIGTTTLPNGNMDTFVAKANSDGVWQNANSFSVGYYNFTHDIDCDSDGNVFVAGRFFTSIDFGDGSQSFSNSPGYLAKYDNSLTYEWNTVMESDEDDTGNGTCALKTDADNNIIVIGSFEGTLDFGSGISISETIGSHQAPYIAKFNNAGEIQYAQAFNNQTMGSGSEGLAIDIIGNSIFVAGELQNPITIGTFPVASPDNAKYIWVASDFITASSENDILTFSLAEQTGEATISTENHTVNIEVAAGTNVAELTPTITISENATINPNSGTQQDFSAPFEYTVTAENSDAQIWTVTVTEEILLSEENDILTFSLTEQTGDATISTENHTVNIEVVAGTNVAELTPTITISENATINPNSGTQQDFTTPFEYTVTAENSDAQIWTVTVDVASGIQNIESQISIYPNPSNGIFTITNYENKITNIEITDITGKSIYNSQLVVSNSQFLLNLKNHPAGVYFLKIDTEIGTFTKKIIIQ